MAEINAWREEGGELYRLYGKTYHKRHKLRELGAFWNPGGSYWLADRQTALAVGAKIMMRVRVAAHCHMPERVIAVSHKDVERGYVRLGCGMCDTSYRCGDDVEILEVLGECQVKRE